MQDLLPSIIYFLCLMSIGWSGGILVSSPTAIQGFSHRVSDFVPVSEHGKVALFTKLYPPAFPSRDDMDLTCAAPTTIVRFAASSVKSGPVQHSLGHISPCPACDAAKIEAMREADFGQMLFADAARVWLESRVRIAPATRADYEKNIKRLTPFFGALRLKDITIGHIVSYRAERKKDAGPSRLNHEISTLQQMLKRAGTWAQIAPWYEPLPLPRTGPGLALTDEQEERLFRIAATKKRWLVAYCASLITANTTAGPEEIRMLQLKDVSIQDRTIYIRDGAKNGYRIRALPLNDDALWAVQQLLGRAKDKGATEPNHYLLPHRAPADGHSADPSRPMDSWKKAWYALRLAAGLPNLRRYDLRHSSITKLLSNPAIPFSVTQALAGHVSRRMTDHYYHGTLDAKRDAVDLINSKRAPSPERLTLVQIAGKS